jgi:hypothetical protein
VRFSPAHSSFAQTASSITRGLGTTFARIDFGVRNARPGSNRHSIQFHSWQSRKKARTGSGYIDLSKVFPGQGFPSGLVPTSWVGAKSYDGRGGGTGWVSINIGGSQLSGQFVDFKYSVNPDCSVQTSQSLKVKELGVTIGPLLRRGVIAGKMEDLEIRSMALGTPFGTGPGASLDSGMLRRISMQQ